jgi:Xylose isomerase-like TIM barrel
VSFLLDPLHVISKPGSAAWQAAGVENSTPKKEPKEPHRRPRPGLSHGAFVGISNFNPSVTLAAYVIDKHHKRISHVHTKDVRYSVIKKLDRTSESFLDAVVKGAFTVPGDGSLDVAAIVGRLASYGYEGRFVVEAEQDPKISPPVEMARKGDAELMRVMTLADTRSSLEPHRWKGLQDPSLRA